MKKYIILSFLITIFFACEKDDFCTESTTTPKLILRFYKSDSTEVTKKVTFFSAIAATKTDSLFTDLTTDSIAIPLNTNALETVYKLKMNDKEGNVADNKINTLTIKYTTEDVFISRSCGFKTVFHDLKITSDNNWFHSFTPDTLSTIDNQNNAHIKVYF